MKKITHNILGYVLMGTIGGFLGYIGLRVNDWEFWTTLVLISVYGINQFVSGGNHE